MSNGFRGDISSFERDPMELAAEIAAARARGQQRHEPDNKPNGKAPSPPWPHLAAEAYHGPAGNIARTIEPHTESDSAFILINQHVFFGNAVGRGPHYEVEGTPHYPNLYALFVGSTSKARKGTGDGRTRQIFSVADEDWTRNRIHSCLSSGEGVIWEVRDRITKMVMDKKGGSGVEEVVDEGISDKRLLIVQSEFAAALQVMNRQGSILSAVLRDAWDRGSLGTLTKNSPARANGAHVSIVGHITDIELRSMLDRTSMANGFGNRFLIASVRRSKTLPFGGNLSPVTIGRLGADVAKIIMRAREIKRVRWSEEGAEGWRAIYQELSNERPGLVGALTNRAEAQVVRLAMIYALWDGKDLIEINHLLAAQAVWSYCEASVKYIFGDSLGNPTADAIFIALKNAGETGLTRTEISGLFSKNVSAAQISLALKELLDLGLATMRHAPTQGGGRPSEIWAIRADR